MRNNMITGSYTFSMDTQIAPSWLLLFNASAKAIIEAHDQVHSHNLLELLTEIDPTTATYSLQVRFTELAAYEEFDVTVFPEILSVLNSGFLNKYGQFSTVLQDV